MAKLTELAARKKWLRVFILLLDGKPVATEYQILDGRTIRALRADVDQDFDRYSPGTYLSWRILEQAFDGRYDCYSMGAGANPYKLRWSNQLQTISGVRILRRTPRTLLWHLLEYRIRPLVRRVRDRLQSRRRASPAQSSEQD
jgi:CelD/BcsL family acetyltransferase involved in cellulose biosynthesis